MLCNKQPQTSRKFDHNKHLLSLLPRLPVSWGNSPGCGLSESESRPSSSACHVCAFWGPGWRGGSSPEEFFSWKITEMIKDKSNYASTTQASVCVTSAYISLSTASHVAKARVGGAGTCTHLKGEGSRSDNLLRMIWWDTKPKRPSYPNSLPCCR